MNSKTKKVIISFLGFLVLTAGIVAGIYLVSKNQDIREKAAPATSLSFLPASQNKNPGQTINLTLNAETGENKITGIDIEVLFDPAVIQLTQMTGTSAISPLSTIIKNGVIDNTAGKARFVAFTAVKLDAISGNLNLVTLTGTVTSGAVSGSSQISVSATTTMSAADEGVNVIVNKSPATIVISGTGSTSATATATATGIATATATSRATATATSVSTKTPTATPTLAPGGVGGGNVTQPTATATTAPQATVPPDLPVTGVSLPLMASVSLGIVALAFSLFLAF